MGLRQENPLIDNDLNLIIEAYERAMLKSRDSDSVFVPFRRQLEKMGNLPKSIVASIDAVPLPSSGTSDDLTKDTRYSQGRDDSLTSDDFAGATSSDFLFEAPPRVPTVEEEVGDPTSGEAVEDGEDDESWQDKVADWVAECIPCDFRTLSSLDADFFKDIAESWLDALKQVWENMKDLDGLLSDEDVINPFCELADALKINCPSDLEKLLFLLSTLLDRLELQVGIDLGILDDYLSSILEPIFSELASMLDLLDDAILEPIRCVLDVIQYNINRGPEMALQLQEAYSVSGRTGWGSVTAPASSEASESQSAAERARQEVQEQQAAEAAAQRNPEDVLRRVNEAFEAADYTLNALNRFKNLVEAGRDYIEEKKDWLLNVIEEFLNNGFERWNDTVSFAEGKQDILQYISLLKAFIDAAKNDEFECGPDSGSITRSGIKTVFEHFQHPAEALDVTVEDGIIIARRNPPSTSTVSDPDVSQESNIDNIVARRPISSCLNKVTDDEAEQVSLWIRQLEQES